MEKKNLIYIVVLLTIILGVLAGIYLIKENKFFDNKFIGEQIEKEIVDLGNGAKDDQGNIIDGEIEKKLITDNFSIDIPEGWRTMTAPMGVSGMVVDANKITTDPAAQKVNFQSYFSVVYDSLQGKNHQEYIDYVKSALSVSFSGVVFFEEKQIIINGRESYALEFEITQQGVDFKVLMVLVMGEGEDVWAISFNTTQKDWNDYKDIFSEIVNSFQIKI